jgi:Flp pilus assembly protein TadG
MTVLPPRPSSARPTGFLRRLAADRAGNTLALAAAALFPLLALVGGGVDLGRGYLAQSRLQQACDAGVLAARKRLGTEAAVTGIIPDDAAETGQKFFNINFQDGSYGTRDRNFAMTLEESHAVSGDARVDVPTTLMSIFGFGQISLQVSCQAQIDMANTDVMMVLDTTGSMAQTNPGDTVPKITALKNTVLSFAQQLLAAAPTTSRVRFGFVPYSANVNVGGLLDDAWVNSDWQYQSREWHVGTGGGLSLWRYDRLDHDVSNWRAESNGCIEERQTYEIGDYNNVDLTRALDLDIDKVPTTDVTTKWSPSYPQLVYARSLKYTGSGSFTTAQKMTSDEYVSPMLVGAAGCPAAAHKLSTFSIAQLTAFLGTLTPGGSTYHDIGMIWGGRLLSPTGIFASENADVNGSPTSRNLIFMTDGETAPLDITYSSYGLEPLDQRRWHQGSAFTLTQTVEKRFAFACEEVKKRNITVWVISFGTAANPVMQACAGTGRYFVAADATQLQQAFTTIAQRMGDLRVTR